MPVHRSAVRSFLDGPGLTPTDLAMVFLMREDDDTKPRPMPTLTMREVPGAVQALAALGVKSVKIFAGSRVRDARASQGLSPTGLMARAIGAAKKAAPDVLVMTETCVCSHNDSGECWLADERGEMDLEETTEVLAAQAVMQADVGADIVGPAAMMPGSVRAVREALDAAGHKAVGIMPHLIFESSLYEGYRASMGATPRSGARVFQINPGRPEQAVHVAREMVDEGADMILTEPALHTVDTLVHLKDKIPVPLVPFSVSGEYLRLTDRRDDGGRDVKGLIEAYTVLKRAGATRVITYAALEIARELRAS
ncbi:hypothetical protein NGF19_27625 [Streptomyces sp. RY43-2]|uniref:Delta-aminolevulinic acid dehydratase n=1 Tax=Streptomyces macrolidinus TaxID=2952607 RepID=A0ABT0ZLU5_9ACTN|nr:hypothetical protein [Streptomyces macrolidinus]MCN9244508.1 hypothetical protein [Streptomyces macrolidinus]